MKEGVGVMEGREESLSHLSCLALGVPLAELRRDRPLDRLAALHPPRDGGVNSPRLGRRQRERPSLRDAPELLLDEHL